MFVTTNIRSLLIRVKTEDKKFNRKKECRYSVQCACSQRELIWSVRRAVSPQYLSSLLLQRHRHSVANPADTCSIRLISLIPLLAMAYAVDVDDLTDTTSDDF